MRLFLIKVFVLSLIFILPKTTYAEYCWMVGCVGDIGYIYIPKSQSITKSLLPKQTWDGTVGKVNSHNRYKLDISKRLFIELGLPNVNDIVTLNSNACLLDENGIVKNEGLKKLFKSPYDYDENKKIATIREYDIICESTAMRKGTKLKILGYKRFDEKYPLSQMLFVLVQILFDG